MFIIDKVQRLKYYIYCYNLVAVSVELLATFTFLMLAYFGPRLLQESSVEQARVRASPFKKRRGRKELRKKGNDQRNKPHVHLDKPETIICTQHTLGINALLVLVMSFIYGCLARDSRGRLYVYLRPRLQEAVEFDSDMR
jgi:hypothetical protein